MYKKLIILLGLVGMLSGTLAWAKDKPIELEMKYFQDQVGIGLEVQIKNGEKVESGEIILCLETKGLRLTSKVALGLGLKGKDENKVTLDFGDKLLIEQKVTVEDFEPDWDLMFKLSKRNVLGSLGLQTILSHQICLDFKNDKVTFIERPNKDKENAKKKEDQKDILEVKLHQGYLIKIAFPNKTEALIALATCGGKPVVTKHKDGYEIISGLPIALNKEVLKKAEIPEDLLSMWPFGKDRKPYFIENLEIGGGIINKAQIKGLPDGFKLENKEIDGFIGPTFLYDYKATFDFQEDKLFLEKH